MWEKQQLQVRVTGGVKGEGGGAGYDKGGSIMVCMLANMHWGRDAQCGTAAAAHESTAAVRRDRGRGWVGVG